MGITLMSPSAIVYDGRREPLTYLLEDTDANRRLVGRYIDVYEYPDARIKIHADGVALPSRPYDRLSEIVQGAVVHHKRLGHVLQVAQLIQADRDNRRASGSPSRSISCCEPVVTRLRPGATSKR
ncbi:hypothetical protein [Paraburkholderia strydomiana]|uniref:hypothetical protein n=1 Tax=Paraburkholderia strydomiana TaxID=1245417 RepID=UPI0038BC95DB